jgi:hypothetical protein
VLWMTLMLHESASRVPCSRDWSVSLTRSRRVGKGHGDGRFRWHPPDHWRRPPPALRPGNCFVWNSRRHTQETPKLARRLRERLFLSDWNRCIDSLSGAAATASYDHSE